MNGRSSDRGAVMTSISTRHGKDTGPWAFVLSCVLRALLLGALWWVLVDGDLTSWPVGVPVIAIAVAVSLLAGGREPAHWRLASWLKFVPYFAWKSVLGAFDVARRAYYPGLSLNPIFHEYPLRLSTERGRVFFANAVSLLPGTLSAELRDRHLVVHVLDTARPFTHDLTSLEERVGQLVGQDLGPAQTVKSSR